MSESAVILEGEVARRFNPVDKLRATNQDSSVSDWVPSDTLDLGNLMASENNLYLANIDDDCDAYEEVEVDVSEELEDGDYKKITGKGNDGNDYAVGLDENGNLTSEMVPSAIHIVIKPRKLEYEDGETLDFTGIHVYLMDGNNKRFTSEDYPTGEIPFDELVFPVTIADASEYDVKTATLNGVSIPFIEVSRFFIPDELGRTEYDQTVSFKNNLQQSVTVKAYGNGGFCFTWFEEDAYTAYWSAPAYGLYYSQSSSKVGTTSNSKKNIQIVTLGSSASYWETYANPLPPDCDTSGLTYQQIIDVLYDGEITGGNDGIPVQWMRSDGEVLEDSFTITTNANSSTSDSGSGHTTGGF